MWKLLELNCRCAVDVIQPNVSYPEGLSSAIIIDTQSKMTLVG